MRFGRRREPPPPAVEPGPSYADVVAEHHRAIDKARRVARAGRPLTQLDLARALVAIDDAFRQEAD